MNIEDYIRALIYHFRERKAPPISTPPAKHSKPHREHPEWGLSKQERKNREHIRHLSRRRRK